MKVFLRTKTAAVLLSVFCTLLWGTAFPFIKLGYSAFGVADGDVGSMLLFAGCRFFLAGLMVLPVTALQHTRVLPKKADVLPIVTLGLVLTAGQYFFTYIGLGFTSGANTSIITACASFLTVLAAPVFFRSDRLTVLKILGCVLGFGGVLVMNQGGGVSGDTLFGDSMIFISTACAAAGNLLSKKVASGRNPLTVTAWQLLAGGGLLAVAGLIWGGRLNFSSLQGVAILLWLSFVSAAAFSVWTALLKHHPASKISVYTLLIPVFGTALSGLLLGEAVFKIETLLALLLIAAGIVLVNITIKAKGEGHD